MVIECTKKLNYFPAQNGVSKYYIPRMILHKQNINFDKHCKYVFGEYVKAHDKPTHSNTNEAAHCIASIWGQFQALKVVMSYGTWQQTVYLFTAASHQFQLHKVSLIWFICLQNRIKCLLDWNSLPDTMFAGVKNNNNNNKTKNKKSLIQKKMNIKRKKTQKKKINNQQPLQMKFKLQ